MNPIYTAASSNDWIYSKRGLISNDDPSRAIVVSKQEIKELTRQYPQAIYVRWVSDFDNSEEVGEYYYVLRDKPFDLAELPSKTRNQIRKCLKNCVVRQVSGVEIVNGGGYNVYTQEINRFRERGLQSGHVLTEHEFCSWMRNETQDLWAVFYENVVIAFAICRPVGQCINLVTWKADYANYKLLYPIYGLLYEMINGYLSSGMYKYVFDGGRSMTEHSNVQEFLLTKMGFRKANTRLRTYFRWWLRPLLFVLAPFENKIKHNQLRSLVRLYKWSK